MTITYRTLVACLAITAIMAACGYSQNMDKSKPAMGQFRTDFLSQLDDVEKKVLDLADAVPPGKYSWRPEEGVRSISEVYVHIAGANYLFPTFAGVKAPEGMLNRDFEKKMTDKKDVIDYV